MTGETIGEVLAFGVGVALSPLAIVAAVVLLVAPSGTRPAWVLLGGWLTALASVSVAVLLLADGADASVGGGPATWVSIVELVVGGLLIAFSVWQWRERATGATDDEEAPSWMRKLDNVTAVKAAGLGVLFGALKPKNLLLAIGAGLAVAQLGAPPGSPGGRHRGVRALGSIGIADPYAIHVLMAARGRDRPAPPRLDGP